jgi:2'-5' RNA ligase
MVQRLFVGVALSTELRERVADAIADLRNLVNAPAGVRILGADTWHVTLQFLGSVRDELVEDVKLACAAAAKQHVAFELELGDASAVPAARRAKLVWAGLSRGQAELAALAQSLKHEFAALGFLPEEREFSAHVTLARVKPPADMRPMLAALTLPRAGMSVSELTLFRSHLSSEGSRYEVIGRCALSASRGSA